MFITLHEYVVEGVHFGRKIIFWLVTNCGELPKSAPPLLQICTHEQFGVWHNDSEYAADLQTAPAFFQKYN